MENGVRLLVFDLDGTLVDSKDDLAASVNFALASFGFPALPNPVIHSYVGDGATMLIRRAVPPGENGVAEGVLAAFLEHYSRHLLDSTVPYPGVEETLSAWAGRYRTAVLTNKPIAMTRSILAGLGLSHRFDDVRGGDSFETKKPDPAGLLSLMRTFGASPRETLMVGDSRNDVLAGRGAGASTCGVTYGLGASGFAQDPPDFTIDRFPDLFARIRPVA